MKTFLLVLVAATCVVLMTLPAAAQGHRAMTGQGMTGGGWGMGPGMMSSPYWLTVPEKLLPPKSAEWVTRFREVLTLEEKAFDQFTVDQEKYNAAMPYLMVTPQVEDHVETLQKLLEAYGLIPGERIPGPVTETKSLQESFELAVKMEESLIPRYVWLVQKAGDRYTARVLNHLLMQSRIHLAMFQHAVSMGGAGMGPGMTGRGMTGGGYGSGPGMMGVTPGGMKRSFLGACEGTPYLRPDRPVTMPEARMLLESCIHSTHNPNLKLGAVKDKGADYEAEIQTKSGLLVDRILMDKKTGWMRSAY
jgi:hypothetical protein